MVSDGGSLRGDSRRVVSGSDGVVGVGHRRLDPGRAEGARADAVAGVAQVAEGVVGIADLALGVGGAAEDLVLDGTLRESVGRLVVVRLRLGGKGSGSGADREESETLDLHFDGCVW